MVEFDGTLRFVQIEIPGNTIRIILVYIYIVVKILLYDCRGFVFNDGFHKQ